LSASSFVIEIFKKVDNINELKVMLYKQLIPVFLELAHQSIIAEDLDGQQHIINTNWMMYTNDVDYLVRQVAHTTGISKTRFVLVYRDKLIVPGEHFYIDNGAKIQLLPVKKSMYEKNKCYYFSKIY
jgi:hypothetical protein